MFKKKLLKLRSKILLGLNLAKEKKNSSVNIIHNSNK